MITYLGATRQYLKLIIQAFVPKLGQSRKVLPRHHFRVNKPTAWPKITRINDGPAAPIIRKPKAVFVAMSIITAQTSYNKRAAH